MTMIQTATCGECAGTQTVPHPGAGSSYRCVYCDGSGVRKRRGHGGYKNATTAARALAGGTGVRCDSCKGAGECIRPDVTRCYSCTDGLVITRAMPGDAWPADVPRGVRYSSMRGEVAEAYRAAVHVHVRAQNRPGTWSEAYLGIGTITSVTDYGTAFETLGKAARSDDADALTVAVNALREKGRASLRDTQYVKLTCADDTLATDVVLTVHRNGWILQAVNARVESVRLPHTYTDAVLNAPVRR